MFSGRLACSRCGLEVPAAPRCTVCRDCGAPLFARYRLDVDPEELRARWADRPGGMWRFLELLPLRDGEEPVTLSEGGTPLHAAPELSRELGLELWVKDESRNPTGSFKDRGLSAAVTRAVRDGAQGLVVPSAGNAGAALSAYAARGGVPARVFLPSDTPEGVRRRCRHYGADVVEVDGLITDCGERASAWAEETGAFDVSTLREPYRVEGKKTMMLEVLEAFDWQPPDAIVYPTGGGTGLIASWKVLDELAELRLCGRSTRLYSVQSSGCAPIVDAWQRGAEEAEPWREAKTTAWGLRVPSALGDFLILRALRESRGGAISVADAAMEQGARTLGAREGIDASVEGGATLAAARALREAGELQAGERVVLFNTAGALVY